MDTQGTTEELLNFFKALADANRLKIVGLLARQELTGEQIAEMLGLSTSTVSHHLARLSEARLVSARAQGYYNVYRLEEETLKSMAERLLKGESIPAAAADVDLEAFDRKVLKAYLGPDGRFKSLPTQQKKLEVVLRHIAAGFTPGVRYTEKQVNQQVSRFADDISGVRRDMIDLKIMQRTRDGSEYWLSE